VLAGQVNAQLKNNKFADAQNSPLQHGLGLHKYCSLEPMGNKIQKSMYEWQILKFVTAEQQWGIT
jgi:hypothetical protein